MIKNKPKDFIEVEVQMAINALQTQYENWRIKSKEADDVLYHLLKGCVNFYKLLTKDAEFQSIFKKSCMFSWHRNTSLTTLIAKSVFGPKNKQVYGYIKALDAAIAEGIGSNGGGDMVHWLQKNGGISGVTRVPVAESKARIEREFRVYVARNANRLGLADKLKHFKYSGISNIIDSGSQAVMLFEFDRSTDTIMPRFICYDDRAVDLLWEARGEAIMGHDAYLRNKEKFIEGISKINPEKAAIVSKEFKKISSLERINKNSSSIDDLCKSA